MMFDISLSGAPWVDADEKLTVVRGDLSIDGESMHGFGAVLGAWSAAEYQRQWLEGVQRLLDGGHRSALVGSYADPSNGAYGIWFPMWREGSRVRIQAQLFAAEYLGGPIDITRLYEYVCELMEGDDEGHTYAVYDTDIGALAAYAHRVASTV